MNAANRRALHRAAGFTLTELMITVGVVIILASIAIPNFRDQVIRSHRSDAMASLLRIAAAQERFFLQNNTYTDSFGADGLNIDDKSADERYQLSIANATVNGFTASANAIGVQQDDKGCARFQINEQGDRTAEDTGGADATKHCWR